MARNMYGATSADFTLTSGGRPVAGAELTIWDARTGGTQITDLLDADSVACTTVTSDAAGAVVYYGPDTDLSVHWADSGQGARVAIRPVDITGEPPTLTIGTVDSGTAAVAITGDSPDYTIDFTLPPVGTNGVNTAAIQDNAVTGDKIAADAVGSSEIAANAVGSSELADNAVDTAAIATGAVTAAKILIGAATVGSGTGTPEGVVTAAPGSTWLQTDATTDVKGWIKWVKATGTGNTGWVAGPEADTGWREFAADGAGWGGNVRVRRIGQTVNIGSSDLTMSTTATVTTSLPTGFRPSFATCGAAFNNWTGAALVTSVSVATVNVYPETALTNTRAATLGGSWQTTDAWLVRFQAALSDERHVHTNVHERRGSGVRYFQARHPVRNDWPANHTRKETP